MTERKKVARRVPLEMSLADALRFIPPKRCDEAYLVLTVCCFYLQTGALMPSCLRAWLDGYLTVERAQIKGSRGLSMANLEVVLRKTRAQMDSTGRGKVSRTMAEYANTLGIDESTVKKWRRSRKYAAVVAVSSHLSVLVDELLSKRLGEK